MKGFKSTPTDPYSYTQDGVWKKGQYTFQAVVLSDSGYAFAFQRSDTTWQTVDLSWQVKDGSYSKIQWTFTLEADAVAFRLIANTVTGETIVVQPMLEKGTNGSTPIAHEEDLRGMDGDNHEFIFIRNTTGIAPETPLSTQDSDYIPEGWTDNAQGVTSAIPFEFVSMREKKNSVWLDFSPPSLWAKWGEDGLSVNLHVEGHYNSKWVGVTKVTEIIGGVDVGGIEVIKVSAVFRKGETNIAATEAQSRGFQWYVNNVHLTEFDDQPYITLDETYGDGFADYVVLSYLVNSLREEERREILNVSEGMDGIGEEFIFKAHDDGEVAPVLPQTTDEGYQNDDYHGDWHDNPVAPTEVLQFVWVAKRKKVGGEWQAFGVPSVWTKWVTDGEDSKTLTLSASATVMACTSDNQPKAGQTIKVNAKLQNITGMTTFTAIPYNDAGTALPAVVLGSNPSDDNEKTLTSSMWLATYSKVVITATLGTLTDTVTISRLPDGAPGADAWTLTLSASAIVMACTSDNQPKAGQTIVINAKLQNLVGSVIFTAIPYNDAGTALTAVALGDNVDNGKEKTLTSAQWLATYNRVVITATRGALTDTITITRLPDGGDGTDGEDGVVKTISLSATTNAIHITEGNTPIPASVTVTGTAKNTTILSWSYSVDGASSFTSSVPPGVSRSSNVVTINSSTARFKTLSIKARSSVDDVDDVVTITRGGGAPYVNATTNTWWAWDDATGAFTDTGMKPVGSDGAIPYPAGYYDSTKWYRRDAEYAPYVQHTETLYLLIKDTPNAGIPTSNGEFWKAFNQWEAVFVTSLVAKFAKIGGAVFTGDTSQTPSAIRGRMISEMGMDGTTTYVEYAGDAGGWQPKLMLDFLTGDTRLNSGRIGGINIYEGALSSFDPSYPVLPFGDHFIFSKDKIGIFSLSSGSPQIRTESFISKTSILVLNRNMGSGVETSTEIRPDGIYKNGVKVL